MAPKKPAPQTKAQGEAQAAKAERDAKAAKAQRDAQAAKERYETRSRRLAEEEERRKGQAKPEDKQPEGEANSDEEMKDGKRTKTQKPTEKKQKSSDKEQFHDTKALAKLWQKHYVMIDRFEDEYHHLREKMIQFEEEKEDVTIVTLQNALAKANEAYLNYSKSQDDIVESNDLHPEDSRVPSMCERNSELIADLKKLEDAILEISAYMERQRYEEEQSHSRDQAQKSSDVNATMQTLPMQLLYAQGYNARQIGIYFNGSSSKSYSTFLNNWKTVENDFRGRPRVELFRQLKKCLSGQVRTLIIEIPDSETAVDEAFEKLNRLYLRPLKSVLDAYRQVIDVPAMKEGTQDDYRNVYHKFVSIESVNKLYDINDTTSKALWIISNTMKKFNAKTENEWWKWMKRNYFNPDARLQYNVSEACMQSFLEYQIEVGIPYGHTSPMEKLDRENRRMQMRNETRPRNDNLPRRRVISSTFTNRRQNQCFICEKTNHITAHCRAKEWKPEEELLHIAQHKKLCRGCFEPFTRAHSCNARCDRCNRRHLTRLHDVVERQFPYEKQLNARAMGESSSGSTFKPKFGGRNQSNDYAPRKDETRGGQYVGTGKGE